VTKQTSLLALFAAVGALVVIGLLVAPLGGATPPGKNGRIAFMRQDAGSHWQIWVAGPRLDGARQLTSGPADSGWAVWSPDGTKLAFDSNRSDSDPSDAKAINDIYVMNVDGTAVRKLTDSVGASADPAWSPDGSLIAFDADRGDPNSKQGIYTMRSDGTDLRRITTLPSGYENDLAPRFSPDGKRLVFTRYRGKGCPQSFCPSEHSALFVVGVDGTGLRQLTSFAIHPGDADWSPNGKRIVFEAYPNGPYGDVYVIGANGHNLRNLTRDPSGQADPVWSPDGTKILFLDNRFVRGRGRTGLATMRPDGSRRSFVSSANVEAHQPDWESVH
jgi:Tol biopolymer transport system component